MGCTNGERLFNFRRDTTWQPLSKLTTEYFQYVNYVFVYRPSLLLVLVQ